MDKTALFTLSYGVYIAGAQKKDGFAGRVVDALMQVSDSAQPVLAVSFMRSGDTLAAIRESGTFTLSVLGVDVHPFVVANFGYQSGANTDKWANVKSETFGGLPVLQDAVAHLFCEVDELRDYDTHTLCLGRITDAKHARSAPPLAYGDYHKTLKTACQAAFSEFQQTGIAPQSNLAQEEITMTQNNTPQAQTGEWVCTVCGYVYDGETPFEQLPEDWVCPLCGAPKSDFELQ